MTTPALLLSACLIAAFYYVRAGIQAGNGLRRATVACLAIGLAIYLMF